MNSNEQLLGFLSVYIIDSNSVEISIFVHPDKSYGANVFMVYTGAPQNTRRKDVSELRIDEAHEYMKVNGIEDIIIHAQYN
mgnify:CR=1 FL=1